MQPAGTDVPFDSRDLLSLIVNLVRRDFLCTKDEVRFEIAGDTKSLAILSVDHESSPQV